MRTVFIGEVIRRRRLELGYTQAQLCAGICEPVSISRIERGQQVPSKKTLDALLERLGLPTGRYFAFLSQEELRQEELQKEITSANVRGDRQRGLELLTELEKLAEPKDLATRQFILRSKVILGKQQGEQVVPYSPGEGLALLLEAIRLTSPKFELEHLEDGLYDLDEVKIINHIALKYADLGQPDKTIEIYDRLLRYIEQHFQNVLQSGGLFPLVSYNYARQLLLNQHYDKALEVAQRGWQSCVHYGQYRYLPGMLALQAECLYFLGDKEESAAKYRAAYYVYGAIDDPKNRDVIRADAKKYLGLVLEE